MAQAESEILGTTTLTDRNRISLIKRVQEVFDEQGRPVGLGDQVVYRLEGDRVIIEPP